MKSGSRRNRDAGDAEHDLVDVVGASMKSGSARNRDRTWWHCVSRPASRLNEERSPKEPRRPAGIPTALLADRASMKSGSRRNRDFDLDDEGEIADKLPQ